MPSTPQQRELAADVINPVKQVLTTAHNAADEFLNTTGPVTQRYINKGILKSTPIIGDVAIDMSLKGKTWDEAGIRLVAREGFGWAVGGAAGFFTANPVIAFATKETVTALTGDYVADFAEWGYNTFNNKTELQTSLNNNLATMTIGDTLVFGTKDGNAYAFTRNLNNTLSEIILPASGTLPPVGPAYAAGNSSIVLKQSDNQGNTLEYKLNKSGSVISVKLVNTTPGNNTTRAQQVASSLKAQGKGLAAGAVIESSDSGGSAKRIYQPKSQTEVQKQAKAEIGNFDTAGSTQHTNDDGVVYTLLDPTKMQTSSTGVAITNESLFKTLSDRIANVAEFIESQASAYRTFYESNEGTAAMQSMLSSVVQRLINGENISTIAAATAIQILAQPGAANLFNKLTANSPLVSTSADYYIKASFTNFVVNALISGGQDTAQALQNASVQAIINAGMVEAQIPFLTSTTNGITTLSGSGVGVATAALSLASSLLSGQGLNAATISRAATAGTVAYGSSQVAGSVALAANSAFNLGLSSSQLGWVAGPIGVVVGAVLGQVVNKLLFGGGTVYIHGETVGNITQTQADGSLLLIGTRPAGSLLRTTGTTNDDYIGNDSADNTGGADVIVGQSGMNEIYARGGHDFIEGRGAADYIEAGTGDDQVEAGDGNDFVDGGNGNDRIFGQAGNDSILGGAGNDNLLGGLGNDALEGQDGNDAMFGGAGNDQLIGGVGDDILEGGEGDDVLAGEAGNDQLQGGGGNDTVQGGDGNDIVAGGSGNDNLEGNSGNDILLGEDGVDVMYGGEGDDILDGGVENDLAFGGLGKDTLIGGYGNDDLYGELGQDLIAGGGGDDLLAGGDDNDLYLYSRNDGMDTIQDSVGLNTLKLTDLNAANLGSINRVGNDLVITFDSLNKVTVTDHFVTPGLQRIEFANGTGIILANMSFDGVTGAGTYISS